MRNIALALAGAFAAVAAPALAVPPDFSTLIAEIDVSSTVEAILAAGAMMIGVALALMGILKVIRLIVTA